MSERMVERVIELIRAEIADRLKDPEMKIPALDPFVKWYQNEFEPGYLAEMKYLALMQETFNLYSELPRFTSVKEQDAVSEMFFSHVETYPEFNWFY